MGKVYASPYKAPDFNTKDYNKACDDYVQKIKVWAKTKGHGPEAGKEIAFPVADGAARYIIFSLKPVQLIHIDIYDRYQFQYVHRLTAKDIKELL